MLFPAMFGKVTVCFNEMSTEPLTTICFLPYSCYIYKAISTRIYYNVRLRKVESSIVMVQLVGGR